MSARRTNGQFEEMREVRFRCYFFNIMWIPIVLLVASLATPSSALLPLGPFASAPTDSMQSEARAVLAMSEFFAYWQRLWLESERLRAEMPGRAGAVSARLPYAHCHADLAPGKRRALPRGNDVVSRPYSQFPAIKSETSVFAVCPTWVIGVDVPQAHDEAYSVDGALVTSKRPYARAARARLISVLDRFARQSPGSSLLNGQLVRLYVDQRDFSGADAVASRCRAPAWWCLALSGYVMALRGSSADADSLYSAMRAAMGPEQRCAWMDVRNILPPADAGRFTAAGCPERLLAVSRLWWLSDPLYRVRGNERLVIHETRRVDITLRSALDSDERYAWDTARGGDALVALIERYGRPTYAGWGGAQTDIGHSDYLRWLLSIAVPPYSSFEYSLDRVHLLPSWEGVSDPFRIRASAWQLAAEGNDGAVTAEWWSQEHVRADRRLVQLPEGQTAMFRRQSTIALATAHVLQHPLARADSARFDVMLLTTASASQVDSLERRIVRGGETVVLQARIPPTPQLVSIEAVGLDGTHVDARTRFGIMPPAPLSAMTAGSIAISDPALIDMQQGTGNMQLPDESLLDQLFASPTLGTGQRRIGVYWETYGVAASDSVTLTVSMAREQEIGSLRRLGMALSLASDPTRSLQIRWTEPNNERNTRTLVGPIPVQLRSIVLNLSQLSPGPYLLTLSIERRGSGVVSSQRRLVLAPP